MRERDLVNRIKRYLEARGWLVIKHWGSPMGRAGLPDLQAMRAGKDGFSRGKVVWLEVKLSGRHLTRIQERMIARLRDAGQRVHVVRSVEDVERAVNTS